MVRSSKHQPHILNWSWADLCPFEASSTLGSSLNLRKKLKRNQNKNSMVISRLERGRVFTQQSQNSDQTSERHQTQGKVQIVQQAGEKCMLRPCLKKMQSVKRRKTWNLDITYVALNTVKKKQCARLEDAYRWQTGKNRKQRMTLIVWRQRLLNVRCGRLCFVEGKICKEVFLATVMRRFFFLFSLPLHEQWKALGGGHNPSMQSSNSNIDGDEISQNYGKGSYFLKVFHTTTNLQFPSSWRLLLLKWSSASVQCTEVLHQRPYERRIQL